MPTVEISKDFRFEAAHHLPNVPPDHKCRRLHGHSYRIKIVVRGEVGEESGWVQDFADLSEAAGPIIKQLDHYYLNEIDGLENPTSEHVALWIWDRIAPALPMLYCVEVAETCMSRCVYYGPNA